MGVDGEVVDVAMREWAKGHEALCTERTTAIRDDVRDLKSSLSLFSKVAIGVLIAMLGWFAIQVYDRISHPVVVYSSAPPAVETRR